VVAAVNLGDVACGVVNQYYWYRLRREDGGRGDIAGGDIVYCVYRRFGRGTGAPSSYERRTPEFENLVDSCANAVPRV
jgi:hypothetical protein